MPGTALFLLVLIALATVAFASERIPPDVVALVLLLTIVFSGYVSPSEAFSGFSSEAVIILVSAFVFTAALTRSGVSQTIGQGLINFTAGRKKALRGTILLSAASLSLLINNVAAAAVLIPGSTEALRKRHISPSKVLLPLALATQLGGMATLLTTSNIVAAEVLRREGYAPFGFLDFFRLGGPVAIVGLLYLLFISPKLLPDRSSTFPQLQQEHGKQRSLEEIYELKRRLQTVRIRPDSSLIGATLGESGLARLLNAVVIAVVHPDGSQRRAPESTLRLNQDDVLVLDGIPSDRTVLQAAGLELVRMKKPTRYLASPRVALIEGVVAPRSRYQGRTLRELAFRESHGGISVLSIYRNGEFLESDLADTPLQIGDALLMQGPRTGFRVLRSENEMLLIGEEDLSQTPRFGKAWISVGILVLSLGLAVSLPQWTPLILFSGAVALLLVRTVTPEEAYRAIDWRAVVLVAAMLPLGTALSRSGAADLLANVMIEGIRMSGPRALLVAFILLTVLLTQILPGGAATPLVVIPIAISSAIHLGLNPRAYAMAVALATSTSMLTPFSHPVNTIVMGPGGYRFRDYGRVSLPLVILLTIAIAAIIPWLMPIRLH